MRERDVLQQPKLARPLTLRGLTALELLDEHAKLVVVVSPTPLPAQTSVEPSDAAVLDCAVTGHAQAIVSGDDDLLRLQLYQGTPILTAPELLARITPSVSTLP